MKRQAMVNMMLGGLITMANVYYLWGLNAAGLSGGLIIFITGITLYRKSGK